MISDLIFAIRTHTAQILTITFLHVVVKDRLDRLVRWLRRNRSRLRSLHHRFLVYRLLRMAAGKISAWVLPLIDQIDILEERVG